MEKNMGGRGLDLSRSSTRDEEDDDWEKIERGGRVTSADTDDAFIHGGFD
jgi:hypothetical protein